MKEPITITAEIHRQKDLAVLVYDGKVRDWLPRSQIRVQDSDRGNTSEITMPAWLARKKGFI